MIVLGCIEAKDRNEVLVGMRILFEKGIEKKGGKLLTRFIIFTFLCTFGIQSRNHEKRVIKETFGRRTMHRRSDISLHLSDLQKISEFSWQILMTCSQLFKETRIFFLQISRRFVLKLDWPNSVGIWQITQKMIAENLKKIAKKSTWVTFEFELS